MSVLKHRHEFHVWPVHFGPYGPQDVHYHVCVKSNEPAACDRVLMADGRECNGQPHYRKTLEAVSP